MWRPARRRAECGEPFEFLGTEDSEQVDWQVKITRIDGGGAATGGGVLIGGPRRSARRRAPRPVPKGRVHRRVPGAAGV